MTSQPSNWNAPNIITAARIVATPFFIWMLLADDGQLGALRWAAGAFFVIAIATDAWDGYLARKHNLITDLGKLLDPIADKLLVASVLLLVA